MPRLLPHPPPACIAPAAMPNAARRPDRPIALVGPMAAGKSTVGPLLARRLGLPFADTDEEVEQDTGRPIGDIFARDGEAAFRAAERRAVRRLVEGPAKVIAAGGGAFADPETRALILARCTAVWLDAGVAALAERVGSGDGRPLLEGRDPRAALAALARERDLLYAEAHLRVRSDDAPPERVAERIAAALAAG